jgi:hypothetical protein
MGCTEKRLHCSFHPSYQDKYVMPKSCLRRHLLLNMLFTIITLDICNTIPIGNNLLLVGRTISLTTLLLLFPLFWFALTSRLPWSTRILLPRKISLLLLIKQSQLLPFNLLIILFRFRDVLHQHTPRGLYLLRNSLLIFFKITQLTLQFINCSLEIFLGSRQYNAKFSESLHDVHA